MKHFENECDCLIRPCNMLIIFHIQNFREIWKYSCVQCSSSFRHFLWAVRRWFQKKSTKMGRTNSRVWMPEFRHFCQHHVASFAQNEKAILSVQNFSTPNSNNQLMFSSANRWTDPCRPWASGLGMLFTVDIRYSDNIARNILCELLSRKSSTSASVYCNRRNSLNTTGRLTTSPFHKQRR